MFVEPEQLVKFTKKERYAAQARFLDARGIRYTRRDDGSIALRTDELDRHTLSKPAVAARRPTLDLSLLRKSG